LSFYGRLKSYFRNLSLTDPKAWNPSLWNLFGAQSLAGENVTEHTALTYSAVYNAISLISGTIAALPLHLMQRREKSKRIADDRVMYGVMHDQANQYMTAMALRECLMAHILAWGNGYCEIVRNGYGELSALWPITPNRVTPIMVDYELKYRIRLPDATDIILPREKVLHVPGLGFDGFLGYSVVAMARKSIGLGMAMETFGSRFFSEGTHPGVIVEHPGKLSPEAHSNLKGSLSDTYSGLGNSHRLMLLEEGMKFQKIVIDPKDSQFLESRLFQIPEVARWFNLPPHKLKDLTKSSFSNIESEQISFVTDSILPWLVRLEQNYNSQLLVESDRQYSGRGRLYYKHSVEGLLRADAASRGSYYREMFNIGAMSINEIREKEDMDPVEGGDIHLVPMNMTSLENAGKPPEPPPPPEQPQLPGVEPEKGNGKDKGALQ
jgi:HK97 family phage portal protein